MALTNTTNACKYSHLFLTIISFRCYWHYILRTLVSANSNMFSPNSSRKTELEAVATQQVNDGGLVIICLQMEEMFST